MKFNNVLFLSTILTLFATQLPFVSHANAGDLRVYSDEIKTLCPSCPEVLQVTQETEAHSSQHYFQGRIDSISVNDVANMARKDRSTTVLVHPEYNFENLLHALAQSDTKWSLDKKALTLIEKKSPTIGYYAETNGYRFNVVFCRSKKCDDDAGGKSRPEVFREGEIISIYPICGFDVISIPAGKKLSSYITRHGDQNLMDLIKNGEKKIDFEICLY